MFQYFHKQVQLDKFQSLPFGFAKSGELELRLAVLLLSKHKPRKLGIKNHSIETNMLDWTCSLKHIKSWKLETANHKQRGCSVTEENLAKLDWNGPKVVLWPTKYTILMYQIVHSFRRSCIILGYNPKQMDSSG